MATRKKKTDTAEISVIKGSHLTVTYNNGYPEKLEWDDDALLADVRNAILKAESIVPVTAEKKTTRQKKAKA